MKVNLAKSAGFCFGVKRALAIAIETSSSESKIYMLGDIVHNEDVVRQISEAGIKKIKKLGMGKGKTLLIRAHGTGIKTLEKARRLNYKVVDATCPMVKEIHRIARELEAKGYRIIVIGDKRHDEVQGIIGQLKRKAVVIDAIGNIPFNVIRRIQKGCVVVQSTQNIEKVLLIVEVLKSYIRKLKFYNTICKPTRIKQEEIKMLPLENDVMLIIGSKNSANTKRLYEISSSLNKKTYWIESKKELKKNWFKKAKNVGVTAGASTPDTTTQSVIKYLRSLP
ncbi:MAG TPA: 4-hydroxy-3-methylbut-2-enyl diphosphate reductase [Candidatus Margulisiibacteriota bacterium]|nr:4-hydroxy-3-methylbut-2-enyl diphosphate reductase [Candidatus Margulisiibacteriota bacterium]